MHGSEVYVLQEINVQQVLSRTQLSIIFSFPTMESEPFLNTVVARKKSSGFLLLLENGFSFV